MVKHLVHSTGARRIRIVSHNALDKVILPRLAPFPSRTRVKQTCADVQLKQSDFMTSTENVNKLCLFVQETEHLQVKLTMMVCPERISNVYNFTDVGFIVIQHSGSMS